MIRPVSSFLGSRKVDANNLPRHYIIFLGIPTENGTVFRSGTASAPKAIRKASLIFYYNGFEGLYNPEKRKYILTKNRIADVGDLLELDPQTLEGTITKTVKKIVEAKSLPVCLGGDHSITLPILKAYSSDLEVVHLDAHGDFQRYDEFDVAPCGVVMRRVSELPNVKKIVHMGIRGYLNSGQGIRDSQKMRNTVITCKDLIEGGVDKALNKINFNLPLYISFDTDVIDPSVSPGTTVPEMGGINYQFARDLLCRIAQRGKIIGLDFVELNPLYDPSQQSSVCIVRLILDIIGILEEKD